MRKILFRGKRKDNGELVVGLYFKTPLTDGSTDSNPEDGWFFLAGRERHCIASETCVYEIIPETLGQFTGLLDKNGNKIFEGDIVKFYKVLVRQAIENPLTGTVVFKSGFFEISYNKISTWYLSHAWKIEIIGNIHDNPELLKGESK